MRWKKFVSLTNAGYGAAFLIVIVLLGLFLVSILRLKIIEAYEHVSYNLDPTAERAYTYGAGHFNAQKAEMYDIRAAQYFFQKAADTDPTYPNVYHQLARVAFLYGDFPTALARIDTQINLHGESDPSAYYVRGLIEGYMGQYDASADDYAHFLKFDPYNWAALNDYAWVLLKAKRFKEAADATDKGLTKFPANAWLLNSNAIALFEMGDLKDAKVQAQKAAEAVKNVTLADWLHAYPGNDPKIAQAGVDTFKKATEANMHSILSSTSTHALQ